MFNSYTDIHIQTQAYTKQETNCRIPLVSDISSIIFGADATHPRNGEDSNPSLLDVSL